MILYLIKKSHKKEREKGNMYGWTRMLKEHEQAMELIQNYDVCYLNGKDFVFNGVKFWGSPYSPSFHRHNWAFNADRGAEISKEWAKIPTDTNVLLTHTPCYGILDHLHEYANLGEDPHAGCGDLLGVITKRLRDLKLVCGGHLHDNYGVVLERLSNTRRLLFSNGAVLNNRYDVLVTDPLIITI